jgi:hypothetical protein
MSTRTTVTLEDDVLDRVKRESRARGASFRETLNDLLRAGLLTSKNQSKQSPFKVRPVSMGYQEGLHYDSVASLLEYGEGKDHR